MPNLDWIKDPEVRSRWAADIERSRAESRDRCAAIQAATKRNPAAAALARSAMAGRDTLPNDEHRLTAADCL